MSQYTNRGHQRIPRAPNRSLAPLSTPPSARMGCLMGQSRLKRTPERATVPNSFHSSPPFPPLSLPSAFSTFSLPLPHFRHASPPPSGPPSASLPIPIHPVIKRLPFLIEFCAAAQYIYIYMYRTTDSSLILCDLHVKSPSRRVFQYWFLISYRLRTLQGLRKWYISGCWFSNKLMARLATESTAPFYLEKIL